MRYYDSSLALVEVLILHTILQVFQPFNYNLHQLLKFTLCATSQRIVHSPSIGSIHQHLPGFPPHINGPLYLIELYSMSSIWPYHLFSYPSYLHHWPSLMDWYLWRTTSFKYDITCEGKMLVRQLRLWEIRDVPDGSIYVAVDDEDLGGWCCSVWTKAKITPQTHRP